MGYEGFKALVAKGVPPGAAANIGRRKYGKEAMEEAARNHHSLAGAETLKEKRAKARRKKQHGGVTVSRGDYKGKK